MIASPGRRTGRSFAVLIASVLMALFTALPLGATAAQEATPAASPEADALAATGLPEITINARETIFGPKVPGAMLEGWYIITLVNETDVVASANLALLPEGTTVGDLSSTVSSAFQGQGGELPEWWGSTTFAGGNVAAAGETTRTLAYLTPGKWAIFSSNPASMQSPSVFTILTPEEAEANYGIAPEATPIASPEAVGAPAPEGVTATATIEVADDGITQTTAPAAGEVVAQITNSGEQVHDLIIAKAEGEVDEAAAAELATSFASGEELASIIIVGGVGALGPDGTAYTVVTLEPGTYVAFSSMPDETGGLQADNGVVLVFTVE